MRYVGQPNSASTNSKSEIIIKTPSISNKLINPILIKMLNYNSAHLKQKLIICRMRPPLSPPFGPHFSIHIHHFQYDHNFIKMF